MLKLDSPSENPTNHSLNLESTSKIDDSNPKTMLFLIIFISLFISYFYSFYHLDKETMKTTILSQDNDSCLITLNKP